MAQSFTLGGPPETMDRTGIFPDLSASCSSGRVIDAETKTLTTSDFPTGMTTNPAYTEGASLEIGNTVFSNYDLGVTDGVTNRFEDILGISYQRTGVFIGTTFNIEGSAIRSSLDQTPDSLRAHFTSALLNLKFAPAPQIITTTHTWTVDTNSGVLANQVGDTEPADAGKYWHYTRVDDTTLGANISVGLAALSLDADGYHVHGLGISAAFNPADEDWHAVTATRMVEAYFALDTKYPAFCFLALSELAEGSAVTGGDHEDFLDGLYGATVDLDIDAYRWFGDDPAVSLAKLTGTAITTVVEWGAIVSGLGKAKYSGITLGTKPAFGEIPPVIRALEV